MTSSIYNGTVIHKRFKPKTHFFKYNVFSLFIDLSELNILEKRDKVSKKRPLLSNKNIKLEFERLNKIRQKNYSKAKFTIDVSKKNKYQIIKEITEALKI